MLDLLLSAAGGSVVGLLGSLAGKVFDLFQAKQKAKELADQRAHELKVLETTGKLKADSEALVAAAQSRTESYKHDASYGQASVWVVNILRLIRPSLTIALLAMTTYIMSDEAGLTAYANEVVYLTTMAVSWWFGDRAPQRK